MLSHSHVRTGAAADDPPHPQSGRGAPPLSVVEDDEGRRIRFQPYEPGARRSLVSMYTTFDPAQRAQGIPPVREPGIESWLDAVLGGPSVLAWHGDRVVGHVVFVPDGEDGHELAIFVHQTYQEAGVGSALLAAGLDHARREGVDHVWLTVSGGNTRARHLYEKTGFSRERVSGGALRMSRDI